MGDGGIYASVLHCGAPGGGSKVRVTIFSGPDFRSPYIQRGAIFRDDGAARVACGDAIEALGRLGIPIADPPDGFERAEPVLPLRPSEGRDARL